MNFQDNENILVVKNKDFLVREQKLFIGGEFVKSASNEIIPVYDPATDSVVAQIVAADSTDIDRAVAAAGEAFVTWSKTKPLQRQTLLLRLADIMEKNADRLAEIESIDNGKSLVVARHGDVGSSINFVRYMAGWATKPVGLVTQVHLVVPLDQEHLHV